MSAAGKWNVNVAAPTGAQARELNIVVTGATFTATVDGGPAGRQNISGKVDGNRLTWTSEITQPMPLKMNFDVTVTGNTMAGNAQLGAMGDAAVTGTRAA